MDTTLALRGWQSLQNNTNLARPARRGPEEVHTAAYHHTEGVFKGLKHEEVWTHH